MKKPPRVCVIDLGTNSFHALVVDIRDDGTYAVVDKLKEPVALGGGLGLDALTAGGVKRAEAALRRIRTLADRREASETLAFATSAIREARNREDFTEHIRATLDIEIEPIEGEREARLIYRGARRVVDLEEPALLVDIGGGSTELIVADREDASLVTSLLLGAQRLTDRFITTDPLSDSELEAINATIAEQIAPVIARCRELGVVDLVGSSGTIEAIAGLAMDRSDRSGRLEQHSFTAAEIREVTRELIGSDRSVREELSIAERRLDQIVGGAVLLDALIEAAGIERLRISPAAMREGMVDLYLEGEIAGPEIDWPSDPLLRRARELAATHDPDTDHSQRVAEMACELFDQLEPVHQLDREYRRLLEAAGLVHDAGHAVAGRRHHKHTRYIVLQSEWPGVEPREVAMVANIARYHRRALPKKKHKSYRDLSKKDRKRVAKLGALLRLADNLDRTHIGNTESISTAVTADTIYVTISTRRDPELELSAGRRASEAFVRAFGRDLELQAAWQPAQKLAV